MRPLLSASLVAAGLGLAAVSAFAQNQNDRRERSGAELVLETGGRTGACDVLTFSSDGKYLFAAGDDKVVRVWRYADGKLEPAEDPVLRWPTWREQRGAIYALALSPAKDGNPDEGSRVAIGGYGVQRSNTVAVLDRATGKLLHTISPEAKEGQNFFAVWAIAFAPSGDRVAFGTGDGSVFLWSLTKGTCRHLGRHQPATGAYNKVLGVRFHKQDDLISVSENGEVVRWNLAGDAARKTTLFTVKGPNFATLNYAKFSRDGSWLAAAANGPVVAVRSLDGKRQNDIVLPEGQFPRGIAFDSRGGRLAISAGSLLKSNFYVEGDDRLLVYDLKEQAPAIAVELKHAYHADCVAFHPEGVRLAVAGGDNHEVTLWDLTNTKAPASVQRGAGNCLWGVALSADGRSLGFQDTRDPKSTNVNQRGTGPWRVFDLENPRLKADANFEPRQQLQEEADGWRIVPDPKNHNIWYAVHKSGVRHPLPLNDKQDALPRCYAFLEPKEGQPVRLLVGHYWGMSLIELTREKARRLRLFIGHHGEVMAVAVAPKGEWAVTVSTDQTIAAWSLEEYTTKSNLGLRFSVQGERLRVDEVDTGGPGWESGFVKGDEIAGLSINNAQVAGGPRKWLDILAVAKPGQLHSFDRYRDGKLLPVISTIRQRPLWRLFPAKRGERDEWVVWMWRHCFYDTSTNGDSFVGWSVNSADMKGEPTFYKAEQFRKLFKRWFEINTLLKTRSVTKALGAAELLQPLAIDDKLPPAAEVLSVAPVGNGTDYVATLRTTPRGDNQDYQPVHADFWVNDYRLAEWSKFPADWQKDGRSLVATVKVPGEALRRGRNFLMLQVYNRVGGRTDAEAVVTADRAAVKPRLFGLMVGINDYKEAKSSEGGKGIKLGDLRRARDDAEAMKKAWDAQKALYDSPDIEFLPDPRADRKSILAGLDRVAKEAKADDRFVLLLSGHGDYPSLKDGDSDEARREFVFCCPSYDPNNPLRSGVRARELYEKLAAIKCRKVVLLDACRAGAIGDDNQIRSLTPGGRGPIILAACDNNQQSFEDDRVGHGLFTYVLLKAMGEEFAKADVDGDGRLDANEIYGFTSKRLRQLLRETGADERKQIPIMFPDVPEVYPILGPDNK